MSTTMDPHGPWTGPFTAAAVSRVLHQGVVLRTAHPVGAVDSTQDVALELAREGAAAGTVVVADAQLRGRGRLGRPWDDAPEGGSLAMTVLVDALPQGITLVPHAVGLGVAEAAAELTGAPVALKWPNDVVVRTGSDPEGRPLRKFAGILVQREQVGAREVLLVGIGLNVDHRQLSPVLDRTCLAELRSGSIDREELLVRLLGALDVRLAQLRERPATILSAYRARSDTLGREVDVALPDGRRFTGTVQDVDAEGRLLVDTGGRIEVVLAGTVRDHDVHGAAGTTATATVVPPSRQGGP